MDRQIVYSGQIPLDTDLLNTNRNVLIGLSRVISLILGTTTYAFGLAVAPTSPASLSVQVGKGEIYSLQNVDNTAYGSIPADTTDTIVKQGIQLATTNLSCPAPTTSGFSINYLIEATYQDVDTNGVVLPYYNASNPSQAFSGPNNTGQSQFTTRSGQVVLQAKPGIAATTGTQTTPALDTGYIALAVVTVANGQTTIVAGNIVASTANVLPANILKTIQYGLANYGVETGSGNAFAVSYQPAITALADGLTLSFQSTHANTGASTLNVNGLGASPILGGAHAALQGGEIANGGKIEVMWDAAPSSFILLEQTGGPLQVSNATASQHALTLGQANARITRFTASGSYTVPAGVTTIYVSGTAAGGGAGGGGACVTGSSGGCGGGGGGGQFTIRNPFAVTPGQVIPITIGSAGTGGNAGLTGNNGGNGGSGGNTVIGSLITLTGGGGGGGGNQGSASGPVAGGAGGSGSANGSDGSDGNTGGIGGGVAGAGASNPFGSSGGGARSGQGVGRIGNNAIGFGAGGGGGGSCYATAGSGNFGGPGAPGFALIEW